MENIRNSHISHKFPNVDGAMIVFCMNFGNVCGILEKNALFHSGIPYQFPAVIPNLCPGVCLPVL